MLGFCKSINCHSANYLIWLALVSLCFAYNAIVIPLRSAFLVQRRRNLAYWLLCDYLSDLVYLVDALLVKPRLEIIENGIRVTDVAVLRRHYPKRWIFLADSVSLLPLDLLYLYPPLRFKPIVRLPRLLKLGAFWELFERADAAAENPSALRICKLYSYVLYMIHCNACIYYVLSCWIGIGSNMFLYDGCGNAYLRCFYFATKLGISIGNNPDPTNVVECIYMICCWMVGTFAFAMLLGQIYEIVSTTNRSRVEFKYAMDSAIQECKQFAVPEELQEKVRRWFYYTWKEQKVLNENGMLCKLPLNLQVDMAMSVNYKTLHKVDLFQHCEKGLLKDLVLKFKSILCLPGDYVCRKNEISQEMYIVTKGRLHVLSGDEPNRLLSVLDEGSVFGEIGLLGIGGTNRRTADVLSIGYSCLYVLAKRDLYEAMKDYPMARRHLEEKAKTLWANSSQSSFSI